MKILCAIVAAVFRCRHKDTFPPFKNYVVCASCGEIFPYQVGEPLRK